MSATWALLKEISDSIEHLTDVPAGFRQALAYRIEESLAKPEREQLGALAEQLANFYQDLLQLSPDSAQLAARTPGGASPEHAAHLLGQVGFAQMLAAQAAHRRIDDDFIAKLRDERLQQYVQAMLQEPRTGVDLAKICNEDEATVSRKLKELRDLGISDFRREGTYIKNSLTKAAHSVMLRLEKEKMTQLKAN
jgi:CRP-like cAMP-binding protein